MLERDEKAKLERDEKAKLERDEKAKLERDEKTKLEKDRGEPRLEAKPKTKLLPAPRRPSPLLEADKPSVLRRYSVPIVLGVVAAIAVGVGIGLGVHSRSLEARANAAYFESDFYKLGDAARSNALAADVAYGVGGAVALGAVLSLALSNE